MKTERFLPFLISASLLAACQGEDDSLASPAAQDGEQIRFEISFATGNGDAAIRADAQQRHCERSEANQKECTLDCFGVPPRNDDAGDATTSLRAERGNPENDTLDCFGTSPRNDVATRATTTAFTTAWETGDEIGLFAVPTGQLPAAAGGNLIHNAMLTRQDDGSWAGEVYWPNTGQAYDFYAYYPYDATLTDPLAHTFRVQTDQRAEQDYNRSDLLTATTTGVTRSTAAVPLTFSHVLSLVQVAVEREVNMPFFDDDFTVTLTGVMPGATLGWDGTSTAAGTPTSITMHKVAGMDYTYRALVPAQTLAADSKVTFVQSTPDKKIDMWYNGLASAHLIAGEAYQHNVTLGWSIDPAHVYAVCHPYPHVGPTIGIVYEISNGGKNGLAVSLTENSGVKWADAHDRTGARDPGNGRANMWTIYTLANDFSGYPAFEWVHRLNPPGTDYRDESATGVWYLPTAYEWGDLAIISVKADVNAALTTAGGTVISDEYWSSTESSDSNAYLNDWSTTDHKTNLYKARAIIAF